jgi:serine/threonine-protein kinase SRPK3
VIDLPPASPLELTETSLQGDDKKLFIQFMQKMMTWLPEQRSTAGQLLDDPWLKSQLR